MTITRKTALLFGATGLVGGYLLDELLDDARYDTVRVFGRRTLEKAHPKLQQHLVDFSKPKEYERLIVGEEVFCCLGTTIKTAGSQEAFRQVDLEWPLDIARAAKKNGVPTFLVVSSLGASPKGNFYLRTKAEMEKSVLDLKFGKTVIARPSMLLGPRAESRPGEKAGKFFMQALGFLLPAKYKAVHAQTVARGLVRAANDVGISGVLESDRLQELGK